MLMFYKKMVRLFAIVGIGVSSMKTSIRSYIPNNQLVMLLPMKMIFLGKTESIGLLEQPSR